MCCLEETHFRPRETYRLKVRRWQETFHANGNQRKPGVTILISDEIDFKIDYYKKQTRTLHTDQGIKPRRGYDKCEFL